MIFDTRAKTLSSDLARDRQTSVNATAARTEADHIAAALSRCHLLSPAISRPP